MEWKKQTRAAQEGLFLVKQAGEVCRVKCSLLPPSIRAQWPWALCHSNYFRMIVSLRPNPVAPLLVPHSIRRTQLRLSGGCRALSDLITQESGLGGWLCCQVAQACCPSQGGSVGWSLCQGSVWQRGVAVLGLAGGRSVGLSPGGVGIAVSSDCHRGCADVTFHATAHSVWQTPSAAAQPGSALGAGETAWGLVWNWFFCRKPCVGDGAPVDMQGMSCLTFLLIVSRVLPWIFLFSFVGVSALPVRSHLFKTHLRKWPCEPKCLLLIHTTG